MVLNILLISHGFVGILSYQTQKICFHLMTEAHQENRRATEVKEPFPVLCFPSPNPRRDSGTLFVSEKVPLSLPSNYG